MGFRDWLNRHWKGLGMGLVGWLVGWIDGWVDEESGIEEIGLQRGRRVQAQGA